MSCCHHLQAARDSSTLFGDVPACASELIVWARDLTEMCSSLIKQHVLSSVAAAGGLRAAAECVQIALGHCKLLETQGLALCSLLNKSMQPSVQQVMEADLKRIEESVAAMAVVDDWVLSSYPQNDLRFMASARPRPSGSVPNLRLSSSAHHFNSMVQVCLLHTLSPFSFFCCSMSPPFSLLLLTEVYQ